MVSRRAPMMPIASPGTRRSLRLHSRLLLSPHRTRQFRRRVCGCHLWFLPSRRRRRETFAPCTRPSGAAPARPDPPRVERAIRRGGWPFVLVRSWPICEPLFLGGGAGSAGQRVSPARARTALRRDNTRLRARKLWGLRKLGAQKREKTSRPRPAVGAVPPHAQQEDEQMKNLGVLQAVEALAVSLLLLEVLDHFDQLGVQALGKSRVGRLFVVDARAKRAVGLRQGGQRRERVGVHQGRLLNGVLQDGVAQSGNHRAALMDQVGREFDIGERHLGGRDGLAVLLFVAVRGDQIGAVPRAIDRYLALGPAADRADLLAFGRTIPFRLAFIADRTAHLIRVGTPCGRVRAALQSFQPTGTAPPAQSRSRSGIACSHPPAKFLCSSGKWRMELAARLGESWAALGERKWVESP